MTQHGMTNLWEMDPVEDYSLSQRRTNGKTMHSSQQGSQIHHWTIAARKWEYLTGPEVAPQCAWKAAAGSTPPPSLTLASATETYAHTRAQRCNGSSGSPVKTEDNGFTGLWAQAGRFSCMRRQKYWCTLMHSCACTHIKNTMCNYINSKLHINHTISVWFLLSYFWF